MALKETIISLVFTDPLARITEHLGGASIIVGTEDATINPTSKISLIWKLSLWRQKDRMQMIK